jgi:hypothetical protein
MMLGLDVLLSVANVIYLLSYSVRDILWLRILTVVGALLLLPFYYLQSEPLWAPIAWNLVFVTINIVWIMKLTLDRRPVDFTDDERRLYQAALRNIPEQDALRLFRRASWASLPAGKTLLAQGSSVESLVLTADGNVRVELDGELVDTLGEGRFVGAAAFLDRGADFAAPVTVTTTTTTRTVAWSMDELGTLCAQDHVLETALEASLGLELSRLLQTARSQLLHLRPA